MKKSASHSPEDFDVHAPEKQYGRLLERMSDFCCDERDWIIWRLDPTDNDELRAAMGGKCTLVSQGRRGAIAIVDANLALSLVYTRRDL